MDRHVILKSLNKTKNIKTLKNTNNLHRIKMQRTALFITLLVLSVYGGQLEKIFSEVSHPFFSPFISLGY